MNILFIIFVAEKNSITSVLPIKFKNKQRGKYPVRPQEHIITHFEKNESEAPYKILIHNTHLSSNH